MPNDVKFEVLFARDDREHLQPPTYSAASPVAEAVDWDRDTRRSPVQSTPSCSPTAMA
jgi:hypothetical protein